MVLQISELYIAGMRLCSSTTCFIFFTLNVTFMRECVDAMAIVPSFQIPNLFMHFLVCRYCVFPVFC